MKQKQLLKTLMDTATFLKENSYFLCEFGGAFTKIINRFNVLDIDTRIDDLEEELTIVQLRDMCLVMDEHVMRLVSEIDDAIDCVIEEDIKEGAKSKEVCADKDTYTATPKSSFYCDDTKIEEQRLDGKDNESGLERLLKAIRG